MNAYNPKVCMDTSSIVKWFKTEEGSKEARKLRKWKSNYFVSSDEHHFKKDLKAHMEEKSVRILRLSEVEGIEKVIEKAQN